MNSIMQTVTIQPNRQVSLNFVVPDDFPLGVADVSIQIQPSCMASHYNVQQEEHTERHERMMSFVGALADCSAFAAGDAVAMQRQMRGEWEDQSQKIEDMLCKKSGQ